MDIYTYTDVCVSEYIYMSIGIYIYTHIHVSQIYTYIHYSRRRAKTTFNGQAQVKRPATKGDDDMKQWNSSEAATTTLSITLQLHTPAMQSEGVSARHCVVSAR